MLIVMGISLHLYNEKLMKSSEQLFDLFGMPVTHQYLSGNDEDRQAVNSSDESVANKASIQENQPNITVLTSETTGENPAENKTARTCNILFSFHVNDLDCRATKTFELVPYESTHLQCPYVNPYMEISINSQFHSTVLAELARAPYEYSFGDISIPARISTQRIMVRIRSYFNSSFDILTSLDEGPEFNRGGAKPVNTALSEWTKVFPMPVDPDDKLPGAISCAPAARAVPPAVAENATRCNFSEYKYTPGFWDAKAGAFLPSGCAYMPRPAASKEHHAPRGRVWVHLLGDSNMRNMHVHACGRIRSRKTHTITRKPPRGETHSDHVCLSPDGMVALVYTVSWMHANGSSVHYGSSRALLGQPLAPILCPALRSPGCAEAWNRPANRTLALVGSHFPQQIMARAQADTRAWLAAIAARLPRAPGALAVALTCGVCIGQLKTVPRYWGQLFQRNNYRVRAVNDATLAAARAEGAAAVDTFSASLAAGCDGLSRDVVHFQPAVYAVHAHMVLSMLSDLL
jgi:hypothetical protein